MTKVLFLRFREGKLLARSLGECLIVDRLVQGRLGDFGVFLEDSTA